MVLGCSGSQQCQWCSLSHGIISLLSGWLQGRCSRSTLTVHALCWWGGNRVPMNSSSQAVRPSQLCLLYELASLLWLWVFFVCCLCDLAVFRPKYSLFVIKHLKTMPSVTPPRHTLTHMSTHTHSRTHARPRTPPPPTHTHTSVRTHTHERARTYAHTHTHARTQLLFFPRMTCWRSLLTWWWCCVCRRGWRSVTCSRTWRTARSSWSCWRSSPARSWASPTRASCGCRRWRTSTGASSSSPPR